MESSLITSIGALLLGGSAAALFWKPLMAGLATIITSNRAGGEIITSYKEQVVWLKEANIALRKENDDLRTRHEQNMRCISSLETDMRLMKNSLGILRTMTEVEQSDKFSKEINRLITTLETISDDNC
ncbi:hypothetical protein J9874_01230 [Duffyella gerundensis]|jgi:hypothetical protein|uniref:Uncharacterized protein n=1 Tax=Duffyella gerundensis TaxID=1619313 RepID=A0A0U5L6Z7_9GAMM|nr:hypothetical protein [Duffyella gerundensis]QTO55481.1 hypothetical protein J8I88_06390 [Duffyella gerundensis]UCB30701.1 hypothetical protein J9874_01230 [Duffyella gerundensis]CUU24451.1 hypothetical protein EM595_2217 [Duffyella gerundensis]